MSQQAVSGLRKLLQQLLLQHSTLQQVKEGVTDVSRTTAAAAAVEFGAAELDRWLRGLSGAELAGLQGVLAAEALRRAGA
jgi:hypothetical protein